MEWEIVMGLEVHVELSAKTKVFCSCTTEFGGLPNTHCCPVCTGFPGTLPTLNKSVLEYAIKAGLALGCEINNYNKFDRKNYFYPDLPKAYQISQLYLPFAKNGKVEITVNETKKHIGIHEIHMEEDAGKLIHSDDGNVSYIDYNRCGIPLIEIVSEPDFKTADEVISYLEKLKSLFLYLGISDCKMQEGSLRADVNLSVRPVGSETLGTRTEMKNINSFKAIRHAIAYESARQIEVLEQGGKILQETRRWDDNKGQSFAMRSKEDAEDYRYFPEPDIPPILLSDEYVTKLKNSLPEFAEQKAERYVKEYGLSNADSLLLASDKHIANLFERTVILCNNPKEVRYWIISQLLFFMNEKAMDSQDINLNPNTFASFINLILNDKLSKQNGKLVFEAMLFSRGDFDAEKYIKEHNLEQIDDSEAIRLAVKQIINANPTPVAQYKQGQLKVVGFFVGQVMREMKGKAKPDTVNKIVAEELKKL